MTRKVPLTFWLFLFLIFRSYAQDFKVIGYLPYYRFDLVQEIDFSKITHLNLAFLNVDTQGNLSIGDRDIDPIISHAKSLNPDLKIFISLAGASLTPEWKAAYEYFMKPRNSSEFIHTLVDYVEDHKLDGMDVDLEWGDVNELYSPFVLELGDSLKTHNKQMTAAWPATTRYGDISDEALAAFDFINIMSYDKTGPWRPNDPGPHSSRDFAVESVTYWRNQGVESERLTLGVPFYGYDFTNQSNVKSFTYASVVSSDPANALGDRVGEKYYNGMRTIEHKTLYALNEVSGIMIWELGQDAFGSIKDFSLLSAIDYVVKNEALPVTGLEPTYLTEADVSIYPNPFTENLNIKFDIENGSYKMNLLDLMGKVNSIKQGTIDDHEISVNLDVVPKGFYILEIEVDEGQLRKKVLKK